ncbi:unnamed protein product [Linum trigynum]|uniref:Uncharacterized protein n=1 Tax=Linum trigynum TaxID=586398 RepID=A0AAV2GLX6_9ROSI
MFSTESRGHDAHKKGIVVKLPEAIRFTKDLGGHPGASVGRRSIGSINSWSSSGFRQSPVVPRLGSGSEGTSILGRPSLEPGKRVSPALLAKEVTHRHPRLGSPRPSGSALPMSVPTSGSRAQQLEDVVGIDYEGRLEMSDSFSC